MKTIDFKEMATRSAIFFGTGLITLFGEFNYIFKVLVVFMILDYLVGTALAGLGFSSKTEHGRITSNEIWLGIAKKVGVLIIIMLAKLVGDVMDFTKLRDIVIFGYITFELTSLLEHAKVVGIPLPKALLDILEVMSKKEKEGVRIESD